MKESVTKFDLEAAFKALDEIDTPIPAKGIKANKPALTEIFSRKSKFDALFEDYYDISSQEELGDAKEARETEIAKAKLARIEKIVDLDAESPEDILPSYVGKYIIQCPQCMTLFYKNKEDVEESEEDSSIVNVQEVCQHCGNDSGYTLIGKVGEATPDEAENYTELENSVDVDPHEDNDQLTDIEDTSEEPSVEEESTDTDDLEDFTELDLEIEDDEAEEDKKEESFGIYNGQPLVEELTEEADLNISEDEFSSLVTSPEFKRPISDSEVESMLNSFNEAKTISADEDSEQLEEGGLGLLGKTIGKKLKQTGEKIKAKASAAIDKFADNTKTRAEKADFILNFALEEYVKTLEVDEKGKPLADAEGRKYSKFMVIGYKETFSNGKKITAMPSPDNKDMVIGMPEPQERSTYQEAEDLAKGWSSREGNGPAKIYIVNDKKKGNMLCSFFKGQLVTNQDQLEKLFGLVKKDLEGKELMQKGGGVEKSNTRTDIKTKEITAGQLKKGNKLVVADKIFEVVEVKESTFGEDHIAINVKSEDGNVSEDQYDKDAKVIIVDESSDSKQSEPDYSNYPRTYESISNSKGTSNIKSVMEDLQDIDDKALSKLISESLVQTYNNVTDFKVKNCIYMNERLEIYGTVSFASGRTRNITYKFNEAIKTKKGNIAFKGLNEKLGKDKQFSIVGKCKNNKFIIESFKCNTKK